MLVKMLLQNVTTACLIGPSITKDEEVRNIVLAQGWKLLEFKSAEDALESKCSNSTIFIMEDFEGPDFEALSRSDKNIPRNERKKIIGPLILKNLKQIADRNCGLKIHNMKLLGYKICISGVRSKEDTQDWNRLVGLIRFMGGEDVKKVEIGTHYLISRTRKADGEKYRRAVEYDIPVLTCDWVDYAWKERHNPQFVATSLEVIKRFRVKTFEGLKLAFVNYNEKELAVMIKMTNDNGGEVVKPSDHRCTHIIVDAAREDPSNVDFDFDSLRNPLSPSTIHQHIVYPEWFWSSVELGGSIDEKRSDLVYPVQGSKNNPGPKASSLSEFKGRSSMQSPGMDMSYSSFLSPNISITTYSQVDTPVKSTPVKFDPKTATKRHINCMELFVTEGNYLDILRKMVYEIQKPLEEKKYLDATEMKIIFGNLPALLETHENIYNQLDQLIAKNWKETNKIGDVFVQQGQSMVKAYTAFVNSFEFSKEMIVNSEERNQQFRAFLMICRAKCGRQSFQDLLITPVQRIPRYLLLLKDILKNTDSSNPDHSCLKAAISKIQEVLTQINENKRKTEGHVQMLDLVNDIDGGAHLLSSKRHFVCKIDVKLLLMENGTPVPWKGHTLTLLLFDDVLEICKKRSLKKSDSVTSRNSAKSTSSKGTSGKKPYKHIEMIKLNQIAGVMEIEDDDEFEKIILIQTKELADDRRSFKEYPLQLKACDISFVSKLKWHFMNDKENTFKDAPFKTAPASALADCIWAHAEQLASSMSQSSFGKAKAKISRTFSMNRRQSVSTANLLMPPNGGVPATDSVEHSGCTLQSFHNFNLPRAPATSPRRSSSRFMSTLMSPLTSISSLGTPLSHFNRQISISSLAINNIGEKEECARDSSDAFSLPSTPAPRKKKCLISQPNFSHFMSPSK